jgi:hypothetical protein
MGRDAGEDCDIVGCLASSRSRSVVRARSRVMVDVMGRSSAAVSGGGSRSRFPNTF